jgi:hypothetical protein
MSCLNTASVNGCFYVFKDVLNNKITEFNLSNMTIVPSVTGVMIDDGVNSFDINTNFLTLLGKTQAGLIAELEAARTACAPNVTAIPPGGPKSMDGEWAWDSTGAKIWVVLKDDGTYDYKTAPNGTTIVPTGNITKDFLTFTDQPEVLLTLGSYNKAQVMAKLAINGYTGTKTKLYSVMFLDRASGFSLSKLSMTAIQYYSGETATHTANNFGEEADDFTINCAGDVIAKLIIY